MLLYVYKSHVQYNFLISELAIFKNNSALTCVESMIVGSSSTEGGLFILCDPHKHLLLLQHNSYIYSASNIFVNRICMYCSVPCQQCIYNSIMCTQNADRVKFIQDLYAPHNHLLLLT